MLNKIIVFLLFIFLIVTLPNNVLAEYIPEENITLTIKDEDIPSSDEDEDNVFIDENNMSEPEIVTTEEHKDIIEIYEVELYFKELILLLPVGGDVAKLNLEKPFAVYGPNYGIPCNVEWHFNEFDNKSPGRKILIGDVILPEGYKFKDDPIQVERPINVYVEGDENTYVNIIKYNYDVPSSNLIPLNLPPENLEANLPPILIGDISLETEYNGYINIPINIDKSKINTNEIGTYYPIDFNLPPGIKIGDDIITDIPIVVIPSDKVYLLAIESFSSNYYFNWIYPASNITIWMSINDGEWIVNQSISNDNINSFSIDSDFFEVGNKYKLKVEYDNKFSNILELDFVNSKIPVVIDHEDKPGTDRDEQELPNSNENEIEYNDYTELDTTITETGDRLKLNIESNPNYINLEKDKVYISIPTIFFNQLPIEDRDKLSINIKNNDDETITSTISVNDKEISAELDEPIIIKIPKIDNILSITNAQGDELNFKNENNQTIIETKTTESFQINLANDKHFSNNELHNYSTKNISKVKLDTQKENSQNKNKYSFITIIISVIAGGFAVAIYLIFIIRRKLYNEKS